MGQDAHHYPHGFHRWNRAHQGAYRKGVAAYHDGKKLATCPYTYHRKVTGGLTWSRAFENAWRDGWRDARQQQRASATARKIAPEVP
jgi:ribosome modulation factor